MSADRRPLLLFLCHPLTGHLTPTIKIAAALVARGWTAAFLGPTAHKHRIAASGAEFFALHGNADYDDIAYYTASSPDPPCPGYWSMDWQARAIVDLRIQWHGVIPAQWEAVTAVLAELHRREPGRQVVVVCEAMFHGILPLHYGAPLPDGVPRPRSLCVSVTPPTIRSADLPPFGFPGGFDQTPEGRARNEAVWERWAVRSWDLLNDLNEKIAEAGGTRRVDEAILSGVNYTSHEAILQLGVPSFFYPRSDWPAQFRIAGLAQDVKALAGITWEGLPDWFGDVADPEKRRGRKVVVVAQGTVETDPHDLIIPVIRAMSDRDDVLVVAILGRRGTTLPPSVIVPENVRVADFLPYDAVLKHADAWVHNGGYGAVTHGIAHGVPMVVGGEGQDKTENAKRIAQAGVGVNLGSGKPGFGIVREGITAVLEDASFKKHVFRLREEAETLDCFGIVESTVMGLAD